MSRSRREFLCALGLAPLVAGGLLGGCGDDASAQPCAPTAADGEGPFFVADAPQRVVLADASEPGEGLLLEGRVLDEACRPVAGARLELWHADAQGLYSALDDETYRLRGQLVTDAQGAYAVRSIRPGHYGAGANVRPSHIHFKVSAPGLQPLTTQCYFEGEVDPSLRVALHEARDAADPGLRWQGVFDVVLRSA